MKMVGAGKGGQPRPCLVSKKEKDLRWELWQYTTTSARKNQIKKELEAMKNDNT